MDIIQIKELRIIEDSSAFGGSEHESKLEKDY